MSYGIKMSPILVIIFREISCLGPVVNLIIIGKPSSFSSFADLQLFPSQWSWGIPAVLEQKSGGTDWEYEGTD